MASIPLPPSDHQDLHDEAARVAYLIAGFLRRTLTPEEHRELDAWVEESDQNMQLFEDLTEEVRRAEILSWADGLHRAPPPLAGHGRKRWRRFVLPAAAAAGLLWAGAWWAFQRPRPLTDPPAGHIAAAAALPPGRATLYTAGTYAFPLSTSRDTAFSVEGGGRLAVRQGLLRYLDPPRLAGVHGLRTAAATTFGLVLPEGTRVWLGAGSYLRYPPRFPAGERRVELQGEAYFEVAPDKRRPFLVHTEGGEVQVLGTAFHVEADGPALITTLLEGSLRVAASGKSEVLRPGEQVRYSPQQGWQKRGRADVAGALDWQSGVFRFSDTPLEDVLRELGRWYGKVVVLEKGRSVHLTATIPRHLPLERVRTLLEATGTVRLREEGPLLRAEALGGPRP